MPTLPKLRNLLVVVLATEVAIAALLMAVVDRAQLPHFESAFIVAQALISGAGLAGLVYALLLQQRQLDAQKEELASTGAELNAHRDALYAQNRTLSRDAFETAFFRLLEFNRTSMRSITARFAGPNSEEFEGLGAFQQASRELLFEVRATLSPTPSQEQTRAIFARSYERICLQSDRDFGHYFRNLYHLLDFAARRAPSEDRDYYPRLVRAQLSTAELILLIFNCQHVRGEGLRQYVERFHLLANMQWPEELNQYPPLFAPEARLG